MISKKVTVKLVVILLILEVISGQNCPFTYRLDQATNTYVGYMELNNLRANAPNKLTVLLGSSVALAANNRGSIRTIGSKSQVKKDIAAGRPVKFIINFPLNAPAPNVLDISLDGYRICSGNSAQGSETTIRLNYQTAPEIATRFGQGEDNFQNVNQCGIPKVNTHQLIYNGYNSTPGLWPWHAAIYHLKPKKRTYACGGTLIDEYHVLTAAHCVVQANTDYELSPESMLVRLGAFDLDVWLSGTQQEHKVLKVSVHEGLQNEAHKNDIAILSLTTKVRFNDYVQPACLFNQGVVTTSRLNGVVGTVVGWGRTETKESSSILKEAKLPIVSFFECLESNRDVFGQFLSNGMFCAGYRNGTNVCDGDSGGGLFIQQGGAWYVIGIVSFTSLNSDRMCSTFDYAVFVDLTKYSDWMNSVRGVSDAFQLKPARLITNPVPNLNSIFNELVRPFNTPTQPAQISQPVNYVYQNTQPANYAYQNTQPVNYAYQNTQPVNNQVQSVQPNTATANQGIQIPDNLDQVLSDFWSPARQAQRGREVQAILSSPTVQRSQQEFSQRFLPRSWPFV